jgi:hypothetical protein
MFDDYVTCIKEDILDSVIFRLSPITFVVTDPTDLQDSKVLKNFDL